MLNASAPARGLDPFGEVAGGILEIISRLVEVFCDAARSPNYRNRGDTDISDGQFAIRSNVSGPVIGYYAPDDTEVTPPRSMKAVLIAGEERPRRVEGKSFKRCFVIYLVASERGDGGFTRVGCGLITKFSEIFEGIDEVEVSIT